MSDWADEGFEDPFPPGDSQPPKHLSSSCWIPSLEAKNFRKQLKQIGIQCRLRPVGQTGWYYLEALPDLPRPTEELFCDPEPEV